MPLLVPLGVVVTQPVACGLQRAAWRSNGPNEPTGEYCITRHNISYRTLYAIQLRRQAPTSPLWHRPTRYLESMTHDLFAQPEGRAAAGKPGPVFGLHWICLSSGGARVAALGPGGVFARQLPGWCCGAGRGPAVRVPCRSSCRATLHLRSGTTIGGVGRLVALTTMVVRFGCRGRRFER